MMIQYISIRNFGSVLSYEASFAPELNWIDSHYTAEISAALEVFLCSRSAQEIPGYWLQKNTQLSAKISLAEMVYTAYATPNSGRLQLLIVDPTGADATAQYQYALSHCPEQDAAESFDGQDQTMPLRLCSYHSRDNHDELSPGTRRLADTKTFRRYLYQYIHSFRSEPINSKKNYQTAISPQGKFEVFHPGISGEVYLSETEEKLFLYICFLNVAEFWADFERIRDLHHEKKPLIIRGFVEFLDESANISGLIARTQKLQRQIMILTSPLDEESKKKWSGDNNGVFF